MNRVARFLSLLGDDKMTPHRRFILLISPRLVWLTAIAALVIIIPAQLPGNFSASLIAFIGFYTLGTLGLQLLMGYAGQISVGHAAFFGIGAYAYAILTVKVGLPSMMALVLGSGLNAALAFLFGLPIFGLRGHQLALATLALGIIASTVFMQATWLTGGALGLGGIPPLSIGFFEFDTDLRNAYLSSGLAFVLLILADNMMRSRVGRALRAISANEAGAASLGVNVMAYKLFTFVLSAVLTGLGGTLYAGYLTYISPDAFHFILSVQLLLMAIVGGLGSVWGAPIGAAGIVLLGQLLDLAAGDSSTTVQIVLKSVIYGGILVIIVTFMPNGIAGAARHMRELITRKPKN